MFSFLLNAPNLSANAHIVSLGRLHKAVSDNPLGVIATLSMNNLYIETATELVTVYTLLRNAVATGGPQNMLPSEMKMRTPSSYNVVAAFNEEAYPLAVCR